MSNNQPSGEEAYWSRRYEQERTGWDIGYPSPPLKEYIDQLEDKRINILIPGAGNAYEAAYLHEKGFTNVSVLDISEIPLKNFKKRIPNFPSQQLIHGDFFNHLGSYDLILEQTFFCSFLPSPKTRKDYARKMHSLLKSQGKLAGLWFRHPLNFEKDKRPYGGSREEYLTYFTPFFEVKTFETAYNSISPRKNNELFGIFLKY